MGVLDSFVDEVERIRPRPPRSLYHFCKAESIKYLLRPDADIWCTHCHHLNDPEECWTGVRLFLDYIKKNSLLTDLALNALERSARRNSCWNRVLDAEGHSPIVPFSFSFSEVRDSEKMWNYAGRCGYRIEFDSGLIQATVSCAHAVLSQLDPKNRMTLSLWPCFYEESNREEIERIFAAFARDVGDLLQTITRNPNNEDAGTRLLVCIYLMSPIIKAEKWSYEREWRLIMLRENFSRIIWRNHRAKSYMSIAPGGIRGLIKAISSSPAGDVEWENRYLLFERNDGFRLPDGVEEFVKDL